MNQDFNAYYQRFVLPKKKGIYLMSTIVFWVMCSPISINAFQSKEKPFVVVLDAGHGGHDSGNRGNGYYEKKIALNIALKIGRILDQMDGFKVIYTRKTDVFVDLIERANIANRADADLFVSIHCDAFTSSRAFGAGTFVLGLHENERNFKVAQRENSVIFLEEDYQQKYDGFDPNDPESVISLILMQETYLDQSIEAANTIQKSFVNNLKRKDRTVKQAGFVVLKYTYMPSVLVETGFLTNPKEGAFLNSSKGQNHMANAITKAIVNYKNERDANFKSEIVLNDPIDESPPQKHIKDLRFKVQIAASKNKLPLKSYNFNGLSSLSLEKSNQLYRYYYQETSNYKKAKKFLNEAKSKGYPKAFIVAFDQNKKITISEALRRLE